MRKMSNSAGERKHSLRKIMDSIIPTQSPGENRSYYATCRTCPWKAEERTNLREVEWLAKGHAAVHQRHRVVTRMLLDHEMDEFFCNRGEEDVRLCGSATPGCEKTNHQKGGEFHGNGKSTHGQEQE